MPLDFRSASLTTTHLEFSVRVVTPLALDEYSGASLRGNFFNAIWTRFCTNKAAPVCAACPLHDTCPVSTLVAPLREENPQGQDIPRPYVLLPPQDGAKQYGIGERFSFGMTLIGTIVRLLPYILLSLPDLEAEGLGKRLAENRGQRGRFQIERVTCYHPFTEARQVLYETGDIQFQVPAITVGPPDYLERAAQLDTGRITLHFVTPLRLIDREQRVQRIDFSPLVQRLLRRYLDLEQYYGTGDVMVEREEKNAWLHLADAIRCERDDTHWQELKSYSNRQQRATPIGGLLGSATFVGDFSPFRELLVIGELIHVGKNAVKGSGRYSIQTSPHTGNERDLPEEM